MALKDKQVILLNGPSSSGKSTLAAALTELILRQTGSRFCVVSIDDHMQISVSDTIYEDDVYEINLGLCSEVREKLMTYDGAVIDHVITSARIYDQVMEELAGIPLFMVHVTCPPEVLNAREMERGDRNPGSAEASFRYLYPKEGYDITVDTSESSTKDCAQEILSALSAHNRKKELKTVKVVAAVITDGSRVFATQRGYGDYKDWWEFPGGKTEEGETPQQALVREIREELDSGISVGDLIYTVEYDYPDFHLSMDCSWATLVSGELELLEHEAARWIGLDELDSVDWLPADRLLLPYLRKKDDGEE